MLVVPTLAHDESIMDYAKYTYLATEAARLTESRDYRKALEIFRVLIDSDISNFDKSMMCLNAAKIYAQMNLAQEALHWFDCGIEYGKPYQRLLPYAEKASFLAGIGQPKQARQIFADLLDRRDMDFCESDKEVIRKNLEVLRA